MTENDEWQSLKNHDDYEININYPYQIRRKDDKKIIKEYSDKDGYIICSNIDGKQMKKHRLIGFQWIENDDPEHKTFIDHKNRIVSDNRIENLRWVSCSENNSNRNSNNGVKLEYVDEISNDAILVNSYAKYTFEDLYFHNNVFYKYNGIQYRILPVKENKNEIKFVRAPDENGIRRTIYYTKFKREYNI